jgi:putative SOS response-associated peptidase YedK
MCGRFVNAVDVQDLVDWFEIDDVRAGDVTRHWNIAPTDEVFAIADHNGARLLGTFRWGLVPRWSKDPRIGARMINARAETLLERSVFASALATRRCLVPAQGFYEWRTSTDGTKIPYLIRARDGHPLAFAGLWDRNGDLRSCTIVTTGPNATMEGLHDRMPAILERSSWRAWLSARECEADEAQSLLQPAPDDLLEVLPVGPGVNNVRNDSPDLVHPLA